MGCVCIAAAVLVGRVCCRQWGYEAVDVNRSKRARKKGPYKKYIFTRLCRQLRIPA